ncbi:MAG TPA: hypothetical protein VFZ34_20280 [Blastocatellia bacterium]|nr:hypothetical protein [Blastocatellia bacterium]
MSSIRILLDGVIDYAGLFPPASLDMPTAVRNYADYLAGPHAALLGRFLVPVRRLGEFEDVASPLLPRGNPVYPWRLSAIGSGDLIQDLEEIIDFNLFHARDENAGAAVVDTLELKVETVTQIQRAMYLIPRTLTTYFETPISTDPADLLDAIVTSRARAKVRTGGVTPNAFPALDDLLRFIRLCAEARVPFKATAGLHHPMRGTYKLTYEENAATATMNGFLNVLLAAAFARFDLSETELRALLAETSADAFLFDEEGVQWRRHRLSASQLELTRQQIVMAFGSCSFTEPVADLQALNLL